MSAIKIKQLDHVVLRVADLERAKAFYRDVLGCPVEKWQPDLGLLQLRAGTALVDFVSPEGKIGREGGALAGREGRNVDHFAFTLAEYDETAVLAHLKAHGIDPGPIRERYGAEGYGRSIYVTDPDGNTVELKAPADRPPDPPIG